jgi:hypothetical protein
MMPCSLVGGYECFRGTLVTIYETTWHHNTEDLSQHLYHGDHLTYIVGLGSIVLMQSMLMKIMVYEKLLCAFHSHLLSIINLSRCRPYLNVILHYVSLELHIAFQLMQKLVTLWLEFHAEKY